MKEALHYLNTVQIDASNFYCDIDGDSDTLVAIDQEVPTGPKPGPSTGQKSSDYW